jgi:hypothetical protein
MKKLICIYFLLCPLTALSMQRMPNTLIHYELKLKPPQESVTIEYKHKSVFETCAALGIKIKEKPLKKVHASLQKIHPAIFELMCSKQNEHTQPFLRIAKLPEEIQDKILTEYVFEGNQKATNILRGCSGKRKGQEELSYEAAIKRFNFYKTKNISFLTLGEMYCLPEEHVTLCEHIEKSRTDNTIRLNRTQEETLRMIPAHIKRKLITLNVLCQRPYKERFWLAFGATKKTLSSMLEMIEKEKPKYTFSRKKEDAWIEAFQFASALFFSLSNGIYTWFSSKYDLSHPKTMENFIKTEAQ